MEQKEIKICSKHKLEIILVNLETKIAYGDRFLCIKCIIEKMNNKKISQIGQTKNLIEEMKNKEQNLNKKRIENFNRIESLLRELKQNIDFTFEQIFINILSKLSQIQIDRGNIEENSLLFDFEQDIERLSQFQESQISEQFIRLMEDDHKFIEKIQQQLQQFTNSEQYNKLKGDSIIVINQNIEQDIQNTEYESIQAQDYKTPALKLICEEHTKEIIMFNLNVNSQPKMACVKCIQQYPAQYTPLEEASILQSQYQMRSETNQIKNKRNSTSSKILHIIQQVKLCHNQAFDELIQSLKNQQQSIEQMNQNQITTNSIYQLTSQQINEVINKLSQNDKQELQQDHKINLEDKDKIFYLGLRSRFENLIKQQQINIQQFNSILKNKNDIVNNEVENLLESIQQQDKATQEESANITQIIEKHRSLMGKLFTLEFSQSIFLETLNQYQKVKEEMGDLQLILTSKLEKSQIFQQVLYEFNNYSEKFKKDYIRFQQFQDIDMMLNQLTYLKESEIKNQKEIELLNNQMKKEIEQSIQDKDEENKKIKEQIESIQSQKLEYKAKLEKDLTQQKEANEQINNEILQKNVLEKQLRGKDEDIKKLNHTIESISRENQYLEENLNKFTPNQKTLFQIMSSQYQKQLTFSSTNKHINCQVAQNGKIVENGGYCLCDQVIPKNGVIQFAFKIIALKAQCYIGIGMKEIIENNNYGGNVGIGYGSYTINSHKYCFSHHENAQEAKPLSFEFTINDIIIVEVNIQNKNIKWTKANTNQSFTLYIDTTYDLYPCLWVQQSGGNGNKVQILESLV